MNSRGQGDAVCPRRPRLTNRLSPRPWRGRRYVSGGGNVLVPTRTAGSRAVDPSRVGINFRPWSVGGGHQNRALAHGYSMHTPAGFKDRFRPDFRTPVSSQKCGTCSAKSGGEPFAAHRWAPSAGKIPVLAIMCMKEQGLIGNSREVSKIVWR